MKEMATGSSRLLEVNVLYEKGEITQIHRVFNSQNSNDGPNIDVYFKGKALSDYLLSVSKEIGTEN